MYQQQDKEVAARETAAIETVAAISQGWSIDVLKARADPGLIKAMSSQGQSAEELLKIYSVLGNLKSAPECKEKNKGSFTKSEEKHTSYSFDCKAEYEKAPAVVSITLQKSDSETEWKIYYINVHSDIFGEVIE